MISFSTHMPTDEKLPEPVSITLTYLPPIAPASSNSIYHSFIYAFIYIY